MDAFRGTVRSRSATSGGDVVQLSALDGAERLRQPAQLPRPEGALAKTLIDGTASPVWAVDHLLRGAGIHTAPPPRTGCVLYASMHGGVGAGIGYLDAMTGDATFYQKENVPFESALEGGLTPTTATYIPAVLPVNRNTSGLWLEFWANTSDNFLFSDQVIRIDTEWLSNNVFHYLTLEVNWVSGKVTCWSGRNKDYTSNQNLQWTHTALTTRGTWHIGWWVTWSSTGVPTVAPVMTGPDNIPVYFGNAVLSTTPAGAGALNTVTLSVQNMRVEGFQVSQLTAKPNTVATVTQSGTWKRTAALDLPILPMRSLPRVSGTAWDVITEIARATLATAEFDQDGFFRWRNHSRWATTPTTPNVTVQSLRELSSLTVTEEIDACRNAVNVKWENWERVAASYIDTTRETLTTGVAIAAGATITRTIAIDEDQYDPRTPKTAYSADTGSPNRVVIRSGSAGTSATVAGAVEVGVRRAGGAVSLTLRNRSTSTVYYHGVALLTYYMPDTSKPVPSIYATTDSASQGYYGVQTYDHDAKGWVQSRSSAATLGAALLAAGANPPPLLQSVEVLADPRIELGDVVRVVDATGAALDTLAWVIGNRLSGSSGAVKQTLTLRGTKANGVPTNTGLTPDPPTRPGAPDPT
ncbi:hypothetical protein [Streptomyces halstedii]|uniref:hypothetical protein n=1 Tax=Streptomyces halstedii TaxID=1944 RepID=UPI00368CA894